MVKVICKQCGKEFEVKPYVLKLGCGIFCSNPCKNTFRFADKTKHPRWKGGQVTVNCLTCKILFKVWPYELKSGEGKFCSSSCSSLFYIKDQLPKMLKDRNFTDSNHPLWKGEAVGYNALHHWIRRKLGKPGICEHCGKSGLTGKYIHWANKSQKYLRDINDWIRLCTKCHKAYDKDKVRLKYQLA